MSLKPVQETIDILDGDFDAGGWDIRKALALMRGGNVPILEWLFSPIMYRCDDAIVASLRDLASHVFLPHRAVYHYAAMGRKKLREMNEQPPTLKVAFYALRAALSARYVSETERIAPVAIDTVLERFLSADDKQVVDDWRAQKARGKEADNVGDVAYWQRLCAEHLDVAEAAMPANRDKAAYAEFDTLLLGLLG